MAEMDLREEVRVAWGTGIAGYVAESGEPVNIPDAYQVNFDFLRHKILMSKIDFNLNCVSTHKKHRKIRFKAADESTTMIGRFSND